MDSQSELKKWQKDYLTHNSRRYIRCQNMNQRTDLLIFLRDVLGMRIGFPLDKYTNCLYVRYTDFEEVHARETEPEEWIPYEEFMSGGIQTDAEWEAQDVGVLYGWPT